MTGPHVTLLVNPVAGRGRALRVAAVGRRTLEGAGIPVRVLRTGVTGPGLDAATLPVQLADPGRAVVVCGGDGTVAAALPALTAAARDGVEVPLGVLPAGTGNDFARALGVPTDPAAAMSAVLDDLSQGLRRRVDLGWISGGPTGANGPAGDNQATGTDGAPGRPFATVVGCGFDSRVTARRNRSRLPWGPLGYPAAVLAELASFVPSSYRVSVDGVDRELSAVLVAVGNTASYGGGMRICPDASVQDGLLEVTIVRAVSRATLLRVFPRVYSGGHRDHPAVELLRGRSVTVQALPEPARPSRGWTEVSVHADGEPVSALPVTCEARPAALLTVGTRGGSA